MTKLPVFDTESGRPLGEVEIPDDVIEAAAKVEAYLKTQPSSMTLHGVRLADD